MSQDFKLFKVTVTSRFYGASTSFTVSAPDRATAEKFIFSTFCGGISGECLSEAEEVPEINPSEGANYSGGSCYASVIPKPL